MNVWALVLAAGQSSRLSKAGLEAKKQFLIWNDRPLFWRSARTFARVPQLKGLVFVFPAEELNDAVERLAALDRLDGLGLPWSAVAGGERRQDSVFNGLAALPRECDHVLVHDAARPFFSARLVARLLDGLRSGPRAVIPAIPVKDTIKQVEADRVLGTLRREELVAVQTPQAFALDLLRRSHEAARVEGWEVTDDASMVERLGAPVLVVAGEEENVKITTPEDLRLLASGKDQAATRTPCCGWGYDVHRYAPADLPQEQSRPLKLGGVLVTNGPRILAHSDGDALLHALTDALLGCLGQGDIGQRFPDTDPAFENMNSAMFLNEVLQDLAPAGILLTHADLTLVAQTPKLSPWREQIRQNVARLLKLKPEQVNVKATTEEGLGFTGEKKGIKAVAAVVGLKPAS
jgi:2-C-methyl-D-erythritol 4-phosphate cytidylyltransferase/2-C-methyl-D-erythritol 2,4-cyclodiphosphate synthase